MNGKLIQALAKEYHETTEAFDRTVCTGPITSDGILPVTSRERRLISQHALKVRKHIYQKAMVNGIRESDIKRAIAHCRP